MLIEGIWTNVYGSVIEIARSQGLLTGLYRSHTGSSGVFRVAGLAQAGAPGTGESAALAIAWRTIDGGAPDAGSHWMSGLSGQILMQDGEAILELSHVLVATSDYAGVTPGKFIDKLTYRRVPGRESWSVPFLPPQKEAALAGVTPDPLAGDWQEAADPGARLLVSLSCRAAEDGLGLVTGSLKLGRETTPLAGFVDLAAPAAGLTRQSVSLVTGSAATRSATALSGWLDLRQGTLELMQLASTPTAFGDRYFQTRASFLRLHRSGTADAAG